MSLKFSQYPITLPFGVYGHRGTDYGTPLNTPIQSTTDGVVIDNSKEHFSYGKNVVIRDGLGNIHMYAHLNNGNVRIGETVRKGQVIGYSGNTGNSTGPHLHYEVRRNNGTLINSKTIVDSVNSEGVAFITSKTTNKIESSDEKIGDISQKAVNAISIIIFFLMGLFFIFKAFDIKGVIK